MSRLLVLRCFAMAIDLWLGWVRLKQRSYGWFAIWMFGFGLQLFWAMQENEWLRPMLFFWM